MSKRGVEAQTALAQKGHPLILLISCILLAFVLITANLTMRTQMVQDSFEISSLNNKIGTLTQDVQERQTRLDQLNAQLPDRAQKLGMKPADTSTTIDLNSKPTFGTEAQ
ncbi:MAG TPA: hypothetical protein K8U78_03520 [Aeriscardovia aeriphila]|uniref:Cell division protein FtsL n=1 Tax=Aeriscardovia aeriphila TaxID=218139 RepID=A0A921FVA4_9BIFI|nr:hypothetical protein [Aeriscardovia aeriphila]